MKKAKGSKGALRREYTRADFPRGLVRGKYAKRIADDSNIVRLDPEISAAFPTSEAVNEALGTVLKAARGARLTNRWSGRGVDKVPRAKRGATKTA
jgi:hypothetical protein